MCYSPYRSNVRLIITGVYEDSNDINQFIWHWENEFSEFADYMFLIMENKDIEDEYFEDGEKKYRFELIFEGAIECEDLEEFKKLNDKQYDLFWDTSITEISIIPKTIEYLSDYYWDALHEKYEREKYKRFA